jgi:hypothetical protein
MSASQGSGVQHPQFVHIPDPKQVQGVRAYREPEVAHPLQLTFLEPAGESAWIEEMRSLLSVGRADEAYDRLMAALDGFDGLLASICKETSAVDVTVEGWDDLLPILGEWEGPAITGITLGLTNPPDLVFEIGRTFEPELLLGLYSDEAFPFSTAANSEVLAECGEELPAWSGAEEDVEFYCTVGGLAELNTALINCKHRRFLRDGRDGVEGRAPGGYVEFVLGSWLLATRFLQAAQRAVAEHGLPAGCRLIVGSIDVNADFVTLLGAEPKAAVQTRRASSSEPAFAPLTIKPWVPREDLDAQSTGSGSTLRQRISPVEPEPAAEPRRGFLSGLLSRFRRAS